MRTAFSSVPFFEFWSRNQGCMCRVNAVPSVFKDPVLSYFRKQNKSLSREVPGKYLHKDSDRGPASGFQGQTAQLPVELCVLTVSRRDSARDERNYARIGCLAVLHQIPYWISEGLC